MIDVNSCFVFRSPHDIDLWSGGVSEIPTPGALLGPTFGCIIAQQFQAIRFGDRFWYELPDWPSSFTPSKKNNRGHIIFYILYTFPLRLLATKVLEQVHVVKTN